MHRQLVNVINILPVDPLNEIPFWQLKRFCLQTLFSKLLVVRLLRPLTDLLQGGSCVFEILGWVDFDLGLRVDDMGF